MKSTPAAAFTVYNPFGSSSDSRLNIFCRYQSKNINCWGKFGNDSSEKSSAQSCSGSATLLPTHTYFSAVYQTYSFTYDVRKLHEYQVIKSI